MREREREKVSVEVKGGKVCRSAVRRQVQIRFTALQVAKKDKTDDKEEHETEESKRRKGKRR